MLPSRIGFVESLLGGPELGRDDFDLPDFVLGAGQKDGDADLSGSVAHESSWFAEAGEILAGGKRQDTISKLGLGTDELQDQGGGVGTTPGQQLTLGVMLASILQRGGKGLDARPNTLGQVSSSQRPWRSYWSHR